MLRLVAHVCPALRNPMDCGPPEPSVCGILQARVLEWVAINLINTYIRLLFFFFFLLFFVMKKPLPPPLIFKFFHFFKIWLFLVVSCFLFMKQFLIHFISCVCLWTCVWSNLSFPDLLIRAENFLRGFVRGPACSHPRARDGNFVAWVFWPSGRVESNPESVWEPTRETSSARAVLRLTSLSLALGDFLCGQLVYWHVFFEASLYPWFLASIKHRPAPRAWWLSSLDLAWLFTHSGCSVTGRSGCGSLSQFAGAVGPWCSGNIVPFSFRIYQRLSAPVGCPVPLHTFKACGNSCTTVCPRAPRFRQRNWVAGRSAVLVQNVAAPLLRLHAHNNGALCLGFRKRCSCEIENKVDCLIFWQQPLCATCLGRSSAVVPGDGVCMLALMLASWLWVSWECLTFSF